MSRSVPKTLTPSKRLVICNSSWNAGENNVVSRYTLISGASSGIGRAIAVRLSGNRSLVLHGRNAAELEATRAACNPVHTHKIWQYDLSCIDTLAEHLHRWQMENDVSIDAFIHSAGLVTVLPIRLTTPDQSQRLMEVNVYAGLEIVRALLDQANSLLCKVLFISSAASRLGEKGASIYCASKGAIDALVNAMAVELSPRVQVNAVLPGLIRTPMAEGTLSNPTAANGVESHYPLGIGLPEDVASLVDYLMSEQANWITGQHFVVDGGRSVF